MVSQTMTKAYVATTVAVMSMLGLVGPRRDRRERGDVPGWVLITVMTAGLVVAIWALAGKQLGEIFTKAVQNVSNHK